jgi:hypothetical protein
LAGTDARINIRRNSWEEEEKNDVDAKILTFEPKSDQKNDGNAIA